MLILRLRYRDVLILAIACVLRRGGCSCTVTANVPILARCARSHSCNPRRTRAVMVLFYAELQHVYLPRKLYTFVAVTYMVTLSRCAGSVVYRAPINIRVRHTSIYSAVRQRLPLQSHSPGTLRHSDRICQSVRQMCSA